ncbi:MAG: metallophosphoesterase [Deltaproteobacteria bacterium]|jgi:predicted MPP superfamily phosphohydrolase|nr:metallophosphoesterase [Deltaproteobacteria bacterium]
MFANFAIILFAYIFISVILPLPVAFKWKGLIGILVLLSAGRLAILRYLFPGLGGVETYKGIIMVTAFFQGVVILIFLFAIVRDFFWIGSFGATFIHKGKEALAFRTFIKGIPFNLIVLTIACLISGYSLYQAARVPKVAHETVTLANWPETLDGLKIVVISDLHISRFFDEDWTRGVVEKVNALDPELILIPGDLVDGDVVLRAPDVEPLKDLKSLYGTFMCVGNHEYISIVSDWLPEFRKLSMKYLYNDHEEIEVRGTPLIIAGVTDPAAVSRGLEGPSLTKALEGVPYDGPPVILLDHRPANALSNAQDLRVTLQLSGHTHGGCIPILASFVQNINRGFLRGWYQVDKLKMYVHPGTGLWSGFPMRLFNPSEITFLTVFSEKA